MECDKLFVKENVLRRAPLSLGWLAAGVALALAALAAAALVEVTLPEPLTRASASPHRFIAEIAHEHLVNLTSIGPRVAGSYENDVAGVGVVLGALRAIAARAAPHVRLELDVHIAEGAFSLAFLDGMNHVYTDVMSVVARLSAAGGGGGGGGGGARTARRNALLLNCHIDTVPDSPGASDDAAGCAVLLESLRALAAGGAPRHDAIFLFNAAEENVLQASHAFITQHKWAKSVRAFINIEACGAGGREVLFQAGPHDPWIVEVYAGAVPHPFASSLAQELFESGLIPADTDFRIFRDFGNLSGVDLAWSANGYVYHTALDTAQRVSHAVLQRTGDNVLALATGLLNSESLHSEWSAEAQPVFFDVLGVLVVSARAPAALLLAALALALLGMDLHLTARAAHTELFVPYGWWWRRACAGAAACVCACGAGLAASAAVALLLHALHARLTFYARPGLLAPLYALPAVASSWMAALALSRRWLPGASRGWWAARALQHGGALCAASALCGAVLRGMRSGFLPCLWTALPAAAGCGMQVVARWRRGAPMPAWWWAGGALLPTLQTWYLALGSLRMLVPMAGRAGHTALPPDVLIALVTAALVLAACSWLLPLVVATRDPYKMIALAWCACACACAAALRGAPAASYDAQAPQRLMVFHTTRTLHAHEHALHAHEHNATEHFYWVPQLDVNTPHSVANYAEEMAAMRPVDAAECSRWPYCGMPYYLPVQGLLPASHRAPAPAPPAPHAPRVRAALRLAQHNATHAQLQVHIAAGPAHVVLIVAPGAGARVVGCSALAAPLPSAAPRPAGTHQYFFALYSARGRRRPLTLHIQRDEPAEAEAEAGSHAASDTRVSLAGHALFGAGKLSAPHGRLMRRMPRWTQPTGWSVDLHLYTL